MKQYIYNHSIPCHITLMIDGVAKDLSLHEGQTYDLPEEDSKVKRMLAQGLLKGATGSDKKTTNKKLDNGS